MSQPISELKLILQLMIDEHRKLLKHVDAQQAAMKVMNLPAMEAAAKLQDGARLRIASLETKRKTNVILAARALRVPDADLTLERLAKLSPEHGPTLLKLRDELKAAAAAVATRTHVAGRLAGSLLGHLNTVVRILAGAVEQAGVYTKHGVPQVAPRIGVMNAVG